MSKYLHIDIETYSDVSIKDSGHYKYSQAENFEILLVGWAIDNEPVELTRIAEGEELPQKFWEAYYDSTIKKYAHNAAFERTCLNQSFDKKLLPKDWTCTAILAGYAGFPMSLEKASKALGLEKDGKAKLKTGKALIRYFCVPCKPTKTNGGRTRNLPQHDPEKWEAFCDYCIQDVVAERAIHHKLAKIVMPETERLMYILDQKINDMGVELDIKMAKQAIIINTDLSDDLKSQMKHITGVDNPNSPAQLKAWLSQAMGKDVTSLAKAEVEKLLTDVDAGPVLDVLSLRKKLAKTSIKKYAKMLQCASDSDNRARGLFQFYGASKTGRWAGRLIQLQNLPRNYLKDLDLAKDLITNTSYDMMQLYYNDVGNVLSQLIRTAIIAPKGKTFAVADFSAIEARVLSWLAGEDWRMEVFNTHGKIYEAAASMMFGVPFEDCTKEADNRNGTKYREKGKVAELALGYQGAVGALKKMGGERMGLSEGEMKVIVNKWRKANPMIKNFWRTVEHKCKVAMRNPTNVVHYRSAKLEFLYRDKALTIKLPSGRKLFYQQPVFAENRFGSESIKFMGYVQETGRFEYIETYGGKLTENIVQAVARDLLAEAMIALDNTGYKICMHVHDEAVVEINDIHPTANNQTLEHLCEIMGRNVPWSEGLPLNADGYITQYYKKD